ncbi:MAG: hypothetical protein ACJ8FO_07120 [Sphingomicrobium sp.]
MRHLLMDPAFRDTDGQLAATESDPLGSRFEPSFLELFEDSADEIADAIIIAAALQHIEGTRAW